MSLKCIGGTNRGVSMTGHSQVSTFEDAGSLILILLDIHWAPENIRLGH
jgi:hypothetical protein